MKQAQRAYLKVVALWSEHKEWVAAAHFELGKCYLDQKNAKEARGAWRTVVEQYGDTKWAAAAKEQLEKIPG